MMGKWRRRWRSYWRRRRVSDGEMHAMVTCALAVVVLVAVTLVAGPKYGVIASISCLAGIVVSPDLDQPGLSYSETILLRLRPRLIGRVVAGVWIAIWMPYSIIPHRHWLSHAPVVGTLGRVGYMAMLIAGACLVAGIEVDRMLGVVATVWKEIAWGIIGLVVSDVGHYARDYVP